MDIVIAIAIGYLLGSVLPAYYIGRASGVDLRDAGTGNPGATNAWNLLGWRVGLAVLLFDALKGVAAMAIVSAFGAGALAVYGAGLAAVVGHRFPLYLGFRGGQGVGTSAGLMLYALSVELAAGRLPPMPLAAIAALAAVTFVVFRRGPVVALFVVPALFALLLVGSRDALFAWFIALPCANTWLVDIGIVRRDHLIAAAFGWRAR